MIEPLFVFSHAETKNDKTIEYYKVNSVYKAIYIDAYDMGAHTLKKDKVLWYTKHYPLEMYQVRLKDDIASRLRNINTLRKLMSEPDCSEKEGVFVSADHSLVVYDANLNISYPTTPLSLINDDSHNLKDLYFIHKIANQKELDEIWKVVLHTTKFKRPIFERFYLQKLALLPITWFEFIKREDITVAYDFTTETTRTFLTREGLVLMDTVTVFSLHTEEAKREAWEKLRFSKQLYAVQRVDDYIADLGKDMIYGFWYATKQAQTKDKAKTFNPNKVYKTLEELKQDFYKSGSSYELTDFVTIEDVEGRTCKTTIAEAFLILAIKKTLSDTSLT